MHVSCYPDRHIRLNYNYQVFHLGGTRRLFRDEAFEVLQDVGRVISGQATIHDIQTTAIACRTGLDHLFKR